MVYLPAKQIRASTFTQSEVTRVFASASINASRLNLATGGGLQDLTNQLAVAVTDFAGNGLENDGSNNLRINTSTATVTFTGGTWTFPVANLQVTGTPSADTDPANKAYVDSVANGLDLKPSVRVGTTGLLSTISTSPVYTPGAGALSNGQITFAAGPTAVDGVTLEVGDRIIVKDENGDPESADIDTVADVAGSLNNTYFIWYTLRGTAYYIWYNVNSGGTDPAPTPPAGVSYTGVEVAIQTNDTANDVASATDSAINALTGAFFGSSVNANTLTLTNQFGGNVPDAADGANATGFTFNAPTQGAGLSPDANGIYVRTSANTWDRATDFDQDVEVTTGAFFFIEEGTVNGDNGWVLITNNPVTIGGDGGSPLQFVQFSGAGQITAGAGLSKTGNTINIGDINRGVQVNTNDLEIAASEASFATGGIEASSNSWQFQIKLHSGALGVAFSTDANGLNLNGDLVDITFNPTNYTPDITGSPGGATDVDDLAAHLLGIDNAIGSFAGAGTERQEIVTSENIVGTDTALSDTLNFTPISASSVKLFLNGILQRQGAGFDYTISGTTITWLQSTGTAVEMDTNDVITAVYES